MSLSFPNISKMRAARSPCRYPFRLGRYQFKQKKFGWIGDSTYFHHIFSHQLYLPIPRLQSRLRMRRSASLQFLAICHREIPDVSRVVKVSSKRSLRHLPYSRPVRLGMLIQGIMMTDL
jgi:hypothetical protein